MPTRRQFLGCVAAGSLHARFGFAASKPLRGIFIILATPYTEDKAVDYEDLAAEVGFMDRCAVQGMVWPQMASEYTRLTREGCFHGMEALAKAAKGRRPALVFGVQGANVEAALDYARRAEALELDALIAIPPTEARSLNDFHEYYRALGRIAKRPFFIQTTGGARQYMMKRRRVFETTASRQLDVRLSSDAIQEIEFNFEALRPYLRA